MNPEHALLSSVLLDATTLDDIAGIVTPDDFASDFNRSVWEVICSLRSSGEAVDLVTVRDRLPGDWDTRSRLLDIHGTSAHTANVVTYARRVGEVGRHRRLTRALSEAAMQDDLQAVIRAATAALDAIDGSDPTRARKLKDVLAERYETLGKPRDYIWLEDFSGPHLHLGSLVYLAARPGVGKSALALQLALEWSFRHLPVRVYDYEMGEESWADRVIQARTDYVTDQLDDGMTADQVHEIREMTRTISDKLTIIDCPQARMTLDTLIADIRRFARQGGKVVLIDYLQLVVPQDYENVTEASRRLKLVAKECDVLVLALSQLKRRFDEAGNPKQPTIGDLRQSGALEQDADAVILLHQYAPEQVDDITKSLTERGYHMSDPAHVGKAVARVEFAKMRRGRTTAFPAYFDGSALAFTAINRTTDGRPL